MKDVLYTILGIILGFLAIAGFVIGTSYSLCSQPSEDIVDEMLLAYAFNYKETESMNKRYQLKNLMQSIANKQHCRLVKGTFKYICPKGADNHVLEKLYELSQEE